jgi:hypothetical protein
VNDDKDDKNFIEKTINAVKEIAHTASEAAKHAMEPEPLKPGEEVVYLPVTGGGLMGEPVMEPFVIIPKKARKKKTPDVSGRITPTYDFPAPKSKMPLKTKAAKKTAKKKPKTVAKQKTAKRSAKKKAAKKWKSPTKVAAKKGKTTGKRAVKKKKAKKKSNR